MGVAGSVGGALCVQADGALPDLAGWHVSSFVFQDFEGSSQCLGFRVVEGSNYKV